MLNPGNKTYIADQSIGYFKGQARVVTLLSMLALMVDDSVTRTLLETVST